MKQSLFTIKNGPNIIISGMESGYYQIMCSYVAR